MSQRRPASRSPEGKSPPKQLRLGGSLFDPGISGDEEMKASSPSNKKGQKSAAHAALVKRQHEEKKAKTAKVFAAATKMALDLGDLTNAEAKETLALLAQRYGMTLMPVRAVPTVLGQTPAPAQPQVKPTPTIKKPVPARSQDPAAWKRDPAWIQAMKDHAAASLAVRTSESQNSGVPEPATRARLSSVLAANKQLRQTLRVRYGEQSLAGPTGGSNDPA
jgi:hypothetical protein